MIREAELTYIEKRVHELYWNEDLNCARTTLLCLAELFLPAMILQARLKMRFPRSDAANCARTASTKMTRLICARALLAAELNFRMSLF